MKLEDKKGGKVFIELNKLKINDEFDKVEFIKEVWGYYDFYTRRSFDVHFINAKKMIPERKFKSKSGIIIRIA